MSYLLVQGDAGRIPLPDRSVDLCIGSPPYVDARLYLEDGRDLRIARGVGAWVDWMLRVTAEALRVSRGAVVWVAAGKTKDRNYWPACEGLMWEWFKVGGHAYRPCIWWKNGLFGSGGDDWFRADTEYAMCFKRPGKLPWSDNTATGEPPRFRPGGRVTYRRADGTRVNLSSPGGERGMSGEMQGYIPPELANPGNVIRATVGGGNIGPAEAHESEAPYPEALAEFFVKSLCPPGGVTLDPFGGSGTTAAVAHRLDRHGISADLRRSQCDLGSRRIAAGMRPVSKLDPPPARAPLPGQLSFLDHVPDPNPVMP